MSTVNTNIPVEFNGCTITYNQNVYIDGFYSEEFDCYLFDVYHHGQCKSNMKNLYQAHQFALSVMEQTL